jgi:hypothetical protein
VILGVFRVPRLSPVTCATSVSIGLLAVEVDFGFPLHSLMQDARLLQGISRSTWRSLTVECDAYLASILGLEVITVRLDCRAVSD